MGIDARDIRFGPLGRSYRLGGVPVGAPRPKTSPTRQFYVGYLGLDVGAVSRLYPKAV